MDDRTSPVLLTGGTGYVGGRLAPLLLQAGFAVRAAVRTPDKIRSRPWADHPSLEIAQADMMDAASLEKAMQGCRYAYYLVHSMNPGQADYARADRTAAENFVRAADGAGLERIIYLGGLGPDDPAELSEHLKSRTEVARILGTSKAKLTFLRAAMIIGAGSASFEIMRYLVDRLPVMITPRWVRTPVQPIAIRNVLEYLKGCLEHPETAGGTYDIGGADILSYEELFQIYAEEAGLRKRVIIPVPVLTPTLSAYWIHLVTPVPASIAWPLAKGLKNTVVTKEDRIRAIIPHKLLTAREAIRLALERVSARMVETTWTDAGIINQPEWLEYGDAPYAGGTTLSYKLTATLNAPPEEIWTPLSRIGGKEGWYFATPLWKLRGIIDRLMGGVGTGRHRNRAEGHATGDALDFWRVLDARPRERLLLLAEMKVPGEAALEFRLRKTDNGTELEQAARFLPRGLGGILYWYALYPIHGWLFKGMLRAIARKAGCRIVKGPTKV